MALTYVGSIGYVLADSRDKYYRAKKKEGPRAAKVEAADCLIWQGLASVAVQAPFVAAADGFEQGFGLPAVRLFPPGSRGCPRSVSLLSPFVYAVL